MRKNLSRSLLGLIVLAIGVAVGGNALSWWEFNIFFKGWWAFFLIIPALLAMVEEGFKTGTAIMLAIGVALFLGAQDIINWRTTTSLIFPAILIIGGLSLILRPLVRKKDVPASSGGQEIFALFSGQKVCPVSEPYLGGDATAIFGGIEIDLRQAVIPHDIRIDTVAIFGGVTLRLPPNVRVSVDSTPVFGGVTNKALSSADPAAPLVHISSVAVFGGVEVL